MNYLSKEFILIDRRKWDDILACNNVEWYSLAWIISKRLTVLVRYRELDRVTIGAVHWSFLFRKLRRDFESGGARTFSDSQGWVIHTKEATNPDFSIAWTRTTTSGMFVPSKVTQEEI